MWRVKSSTESARACQISSGGFDGICNRDDRQIGVNLSWDLFNRNASYGVTEKAAQIVAATGRLDSVARMIDETGRLSLITVRQSRVEMETLRCQEQASARVVDFYRLQFRVARKTLIELLNAENELYSVGLSRFRRRIRCSTVCWIICIPRNAPEMERSESF